MKIKIKNIYSYLLVAALSFTFYVSCDNEESIGSSQIDTTTPQLSELDIWIRENFVKPYNIEIQYEWDQNETDLNRYLYPPTVANVKPLLEAVKKIWIEPYSELGGSDFIKKIAPRQFTLVGGFNFNPSGTITLGLAEAGTKITLFNVDQQDFDNLETTRRFFKTIQHEYTHILNQTVPFDPAYGLITPASYTAQWFNVSIPDAREMGHITDYALTNPSEDFAEMVSTMLTNSKEEFDNIIDNISSEQAKAAIRAKQQIIVTYFKTEFDIDLFKLQELVDKKTREIVN